MALDVFVMPLWRFKAGDFTSPIEQKLGIKPTVISLSAPPPPSRPLFLRICAWLGLFEFHEAPSGEELKALSIDRVDNLKSELARLTGKRVDWNDDGPIAYSNQFHQPIILRVLAAWH